jgi:glutamyl-tRNA(Gln) amidotransferase subunit D
MHHTGAILSFMVQNAPVPIVLVGSQRSSDRPSSDAALNLMNAVRTAAECDIAEVMLCMFGPTSDQYDLLHRGTRCRKMHSSYRSTFRTIGATPLAIVRAQKDERGRYFEYLTSDFAKRDPARVPIINPAFEEKVTIQYYYPNFQPDIIDALVDKGYRGIVIAGTGLGHVNRPLFPALRRAVEAGVSVVMTVQTLWGFAQMYVYDTGRDLLDLGVIPAANMLPETAYMKLAWVLGQTRDPARVREMMLTPIAHEITPREPHNGYLVLQGGLPEVDEFICRHWK